MSSPVDLQSHCAALLAGSGIDATIHSLTSCAASGNNRTYRLETSIGPFAVKQYFRHAGDNRDRLAAEYAFLNYANRVVPGQVPKPWAQDVENGLALYEFVSGNGLISGSIGWPEIERAAQFFRALNDAGATQHAGHLPVASEACFFIQGHLDLIRARLDRLAAVEATCDEDRAAQGLVCRIVDFWQALSSDVLAASRKLGHDPKMPIDAQQRCISPSDFGFHNALRQADGSVRFLDFEYAGWDDPAKMSGDFFAQLAVPVPSEYFDRFLGAAFAGFTKHEEVVSRASLLRPVYQIKWCCIALNVFLPVNMARRRFANPELDESALKQAQLVKAEFLFQSIRPINHGQH